MNFKHFMRKVVQFRFLIHRAYTWGQVPMQILVTTGVLAPYIQEYFNIRFYMIVIFAVIILAIVGTLDYLSGYVKEEVSFSQEQNRYLNDNITELNNKLNLLLNKETNNNLSKGGINNNGI